MKPSLVDKRLVSDECGERIFSELKAIHEILKTQASHFNELDDCPRCLEARRLRSLNAQVLERQLGLMDKAERHMDEGHEGEPPWKPE